MLKHFHKSLPAVLTAAQFSNSDGLSKQFLESADCLSICRAPQENAFSPGREVVFMKMYGEPPLC